MTRSTAAASESPAPNEAVDAVVELISEISTLPAIALQVMQVASDPDAGAADLRAVVENDPALCARVLRSVNSAATGVRVKVTNIHQAISYLGFSQIRNLAMTASVSSIFRHDVTVGTYQRVRLWRHMVAVGICARMIARQLKIPRFEDAFLAGLLHDIGIILSDQHIHDRFELTIKALRADRTLGAMERRVLGFDHTLLGARVATKWRFPDVVRDAIRHHHKAQSYTGEHAETVRAVQLANVICTLKGISSVGMMLVESPNETITQLGISAQDIEVWVIDLDNELATNEQLFELGG